MNLEQSGNGTGATARAHDELHDAPSEPPMRPPLGRLLAEAGVASEYELQLALAEGMGTGERLGEVLLRRGWIDECGLARLLAQQWNLRFLDGSTAAVDERAFALLDAHRAAKLAACPIGFDEEEAPLVAIAEPTEERFAAVQAAFACEVRFAVVARSRLVELLDELASVRLAASSQAAAEEADKEERQLDEQAAALVRSLETAAAGLAALREQVSRIAAAREQVQRELAHCRQQFDALSSARASDLATIERLQGELAEQRTLSAHVRTRLAELSDALAES